MPDLTVEIADIKRILADVAVKQRDNEIRFRETDEKFRKTDEKFRKTDEKFRETDEKFRELEKKFRETDRLLTDLGKKTDKRIKEAFDLFEGQWGRLVEALVDRSLLKILQQRGVDVHYTTNRLRGHRNGHNYEFDIIAHNGGEIVVVEVKTTLRVGHVRKFIRQLRAFKDFVPTYRKMRVYGAVAFLHSVEEAEAFAEKRGLFSIKAVGNSAHIVNAEDFEPVVF